MKEGYLYCVICKKEHDLGAQRCSCGGVLRSYFVCPACKDEFLLDDNGIATRIDDGKTTEICWSELAKQEICLPCAEQVEEYGSTITRYDVKLGEKREAVLFDEWYGRLLYPEPSEELPAWFTRIYKGMNYINNGWRGYVSPKLALATLADGWYTESGDDIGARKRIIYNFSEWLKNNEHPVIYIAFDKTSNCMSVLCRIMCTKGKEKQVITFLDNSPFSVALLESALF